MIFHTAISLSRHQVSSSENDEGIYNKERISRIFIRHSGIRNHSKNLIELLNYLIINMDKSEYETPKASS